mgnify:CR=1 FL=1
MEIKGKVHCLFEQSGTFKNEFKKLGYNAEDYDIQNNFNETDNVIDLFSQIESAYNSEPSIFDRIESDDLIMAFFPCIYFEALQMTYYSLDCINNKKKTRCGKIEDAIDRIGQRTYFHIILYKLYWIVEKKKLRLIIENPATMPHYLITIQNFPEPTFIDKNRMLRGDYFVKPTAYWFVNCKPTNGCTIQNDKKRKLVWSCKKGSHAGLCSEERSMISPDYARNFICDFVIGKEQKINQLNLF